MIAVTPFTRVTRLHTKHSLVAIVFFCIHILLTQKGYAQPEKIGWILAQGPSPNQPVNQPRKFNDVLASLLDEFSYDLKTNQLRVTQNLSVRRVNVGEPVPRSYESYLENLVLERIRNHSKIKVIQCTQCRSRRSSIDNGRVVVTSPIHNPQELGSIAQQLGIDSWLDVSLIYQETQMILSFNAFDSQTKELLWTKNYNSEKAPPKVTQRSSDELKNLEDDEGKYKSSYLFQLGVGGSLIPNVNTTSKMMNLSLRIAEKFNQNTSEIGAIFSGVFSPDLFVKNYASNGQQSLESGKVYESVSDLPPFQYGLQFLANYSHNFFKGAENYDLFRYGIHLGIGSLFSTGYLTLLTRGGGYIRFGKRFVFDMGLTYAAPTTVKVDALKFQTTGGVGADATFGLLF